MGAITILGGGESGVGAALLAKKKGLVPFVSDFGEIKQKYKDVLLKNEIEWEEGKHSEERILASVEVVKSPGIADEVDHCAKASSSWSVSDFRNRICLSLLHSKDHWNNGK